MSTDPAAHGTGTIPHCYRHPERETYISCQRCGRPICPDCMRSASVGFQCPECVREGMATTRQARTRYGGRINTRVTAVTVTIIAINLVVWVIANATKGAPLGVGEFVATLGLMPDSSAYPAFLGLEGVAQGAWWQLITSTFVHVQLLHILMNMLALWIFGTFLESALGRWRFVALYLLTGFIGSVTVLWLADPSSLSIGASGAIYGLFGASLVILLKQKADITQLLVLLALNLFLTFSISGISWQAHLGGLASGLVLGVGFAYAPRDRRTLVHVSMVSATVVVGVLLTLARTAQLG